MLTSSIDHAGENSSADQNLISAMTDLSFTYGRIASLNLRICEFAAAIQPAFVTLTNLESMAHELPD